MLSLYLYYNSTISDTRTSNYIMHFTMYLKCSLSLSLSLSLCLSLSPSQSTFDLSKLQGIQTDLHVDLIFCSVFHCTYQCN